jgi:hypothetical protein
VADPPVELHPGVAPARSQPHGGHHDVLAGREALGLGVNVVRGVQPLTERSLQALEAAVDAAAAGELRRLNEHDLGIEEERRGLDVFARPPELIEATQQLEARLIGLRRHLRAIIPPL